MRSWVQRVRRSKLSENLEPHLKCLWTENCFCLFWKFTIKNTRFQSLNRLGLKFIILQAFKVVIFTIKNGQGNGSSLVPKCQVMTSLCCQTFVYAVLVPWYLQTNLTHLFLTTRSKGTCNLLRENLFQRLAVLERIVVRKLSTGFRTASFVFCSKILVSILSSMSYPFEKK